MKLLQLLLFSALLGVALAQVKMTALSAAFPSAIGIDYQPVRNNLLMSVHYSDGQPYNFEEVTFEGDRHQFTSISGLTDEVKIATAKDNNPGGWPVGDFFTGTGVPGQILRADADGLLSYGNPWVSLGNVGLLRGSFYVDQTGVFDGDLIAVTTSGFGFRVKPDGSFTQFINAGVHLEGVVTVPDERRYGGLAGKILIGAEVQQRLYWADADGNTGFWQLTVAVEDLDIAFPNHNFYGSNFGTSKLLGAGSAEWKNAGFEGDIIATQESPGLLFALRWDDQNDVPITVPVNYADGSAPVGQWEHVTFAPFGVLEIPDPGTVPGKSCGDGSTAKKPFGAVASEYNVFVAGDFKCKWSDTEGRLAAGGKVDLEGYSVGCRILAEPEQNCIDFGSVTCADLAEAGENENTLVGGSDVSFKNGEIKTGNLIHGGTFTGNNFNIVPDCERRQDNVIDFALEFTKLKKVSSDTKALAKTGDIVENYGGLIAIGKGEQMEVFEVTAAQLASANSFELKNVDPAASIIFNVAGQDISAGRFGFFGFNAARTLWNFHEATSINFHDVGWEGTVLAPNADIIEPKGQINGQVFAKSWVGSANGPCMQQNHVPYEGCVPSDEPGNNPPPPTPGCVETCENVFGPEASRWNVMVKDDFFCINSDTEGRLSAGRDIGVSGYSVACLVVEPIGGGNCISDDANVYPCSLLSGDDAYTFVAGRNIVSNSGSVKIGKTAFTGSRSASGWTDRCGREVGSPVDFAAAFDYLGDLSASLAAQTPTGVATKNGVNSITFSPNADQLTTKTQIFNVNAADLDVFSIGASNIAATSTVVVNVAGATYKPRDGYGFANGFRDTMHHWLWNFYEATSLDIKSWHGSILAPNAHINAPHGVLEGNVYAQSLGTEGAQCAQIDADYFDGCVPICF